MSRAGIWTGLLLIAALAGAGESLEPGTLFRIGTPDGSALEFGLSDVHWPAYAETYPKPIVFTVGKSKLREWPYIHPSTHDKWAGGKPHTFTINFSVEQAVPKSLHLIIGALAIWEPSRITITANGKQIASQRLPNSAPHVHLAGKLDEPTETVPLVFPLPDDTIKTGANTLSITLNDGSWIIYDYVQLGGGKVPLKTAAPVAEARDLLKEFKAGPLAGVDEIVFAVRKIIGEHWYANFGYYAQEGRGNLYRDGGRLCKLRLSDSKITTLIDDPLGGVRDPQIHYDGKKMVFAYRKGGTEHYHLYEMNIDGSGMRQLTDGEYDDIEPTYVADGGIVFVSSRCKRWVNCWLTQVAVLHRCDADGKNIRPISSNNEHDNTPWPLPDGRILYTRWEYVDRSQVDYHHLWVVNPDGSSQSVYYGNMHPGLVMIDAKPIPNSDLILVNFSPGHGKTEHEGAITILDPNGGPDATPFARRITKKDDYRDPYPLSETAYIAAQHQTLVLVDAKGNTQQLFKLSDADIKEGLHCHEPRPVIVRQRERPVAPRIDLAQPTGRLLLADVNYGRNMDGVKPGEIKKLLVLETLPKPINYTGGMDPLSYGGTFSLERILGTVPVEADGSAYFEVPALRSVFFVALDENDVAIKRMQSFVTVQPGETTSCAGCHEQRERTPRYVTPGPLAAARRAPSVIERCADVPEIIDYPRDIQPVLDALCVNCHGTEKTAAGGPRAGKILLTGDHGPMFSHSYFTMTTARLFSDGRDKAVSNYAPRSLGSAASRILTMLDGSHYGVKATPLQKKTLRLWIDTGAAYPGTYAALGTGMIGGYAENKQVITDDNWPTTQAGRQVISQRCASCHQKEPSRLLPMNMSDERGVSFWRFDINDPRLKTSRHIVFNLSKPEKSLLLLAPLSQAAGGWGLCYDPKKNQPATVFSSTTDPDYQKLLAMCVAGREKLAEIKRFDMPGFQPRIEWVREMKRYGVLPANPPTNAAINVYDVEKAYFQSLWHDPGLVAK